MSLHTFCLFNNPEAYNAWIPRQLPAFTKEIYSVENTSHANNKAEFSLNGGGKHAWISINNDQVANLRNTLEVGLV